MLERVFEPVVRTGVGRYEGQPRQLQCAPERGTWRPLRGVRAHRVTQGQHHTLGVVFRGGGRAAVDRTMLALNLAGKHQQ